eukprot:1615627-Rhodomonas_salina.2
MNPKEHIPKFLQTGSVHWRLRLFGERSSQVAQGGKQAAACGVGGGGLRLGDLVELLKLQVNFVGGNMNSFSHIWERATTHGANMLGPKFRTSEALLFLRIRRLHRVAR